MSGRVRAAAAFAIALALAACAANAPVQSANGWQDPDFAGPPLGKILVIGLGSQGLADQQQFENVMVATFASAGIAAVPGWQYVAQGGVPDVAAMKAAIARAQVDGVLLTRLSAATSEQVVSLAPAPGPVDDPDLYSGWYEPVASTTTAAMLTTTLFDVHTERPIWTFNAPTYGQTRLRQGSRDFADTVVGMLQSTHMLAAF